LHFFCFFFWKIQIDLFRPLFPFEKRTSLQGFCTCRAIAWGFNWLYDLKNNRSSLILSGFGFPKYRSCSIKYLFRKKGTIYDWFIFVLHWSPLLLQSGKAVDLEGFS
jgi:hypothetical protein